jgi:integrase
MASSSSKRALDKLCPLPHWTLHDLRRTWATIAAEKLGVLPHIIEAVLAHNSGTAVSRTYNRARYLKPMREAMEAMERHITKLLDATPRTS